MAFAAKNGDDSRNDRRSLELSFRAVVDGNRWTANDHDSVSGELIGGRFRLESPLGEGGMAEVYRAVDIATQRPVAIKLLKVGRAEQQDEAEARLRREAELLSSLSNPAIVQVETYGRTADRRLFLVMELLEGETLGALIRRKQRLDPDELAPVVAGLAAGLSAAHAASIVHRDLKPDNIFLAQTNPDEPIQVKLLDFGISKVYGVEERLTRTGQVLGTPRYMAPEQLSADHDLDERVDVYAMGVILYEALTGSPPFIATNPSDLIVAIINGKVSPLRTLRSEISPEMEAVVMRAMAKSRHARYTSALELATAFLDLVPRREGRSTPNQQGKATKAMGGGMLASSPAVGGDGAPLRPGTFSELQAHDSGATPLAGEPAATLAQRPAALSPGPGAAAAPQHSYPSGDMAPMSPGGAVSFGSSVQLPVRKGRALPIVLALVAGAITAAGVLFALGGDDENVEAPPPPVAAPAPTVEQTQEALTPEVDEEEAVPSGAEHPVGLEPPELEAAQEPSPMSSSRRRRRRRSRGSADLPPAPFVQGGGGGEMQAEMAAPGPGRTATAVSQARAALREGNSRRCLEILHQTGARSPSAIRLEGDCYLRDGRRDDAVKVYERFCELFPTHRSIEAVRSIVRSYGGQCH